jgi:hypothetical protein
VQLRGTPGRARPVSTAKFGEATVAARGASPAARAGGRAQARAQAARGSSVVRKAFRGRARASTAPSQTLGGGGPRLAAPGWFSVKRWGRGRARPVGAPAAGTAHGAG